MSYFEYGHRPIRSDSERQKIKMKMPVPSPMRLNLKSKDLHTNSPKWSYVNLLWGNVMCNYDDLIYSLWLCYIINYILIYL